ncbi:MAG TPA: 16S rRNA (cytosine(967)-C(5))-methyltransferase RsmB [Acidobacteriota bacterium]|nr:16S rRNA (cytosine(967)-C(5))-methyltransferase RsmB [Acidobacteriota bacterium]
MQKEINPRMIAFRVLSRLEEHRSNSNILLQEALSRVPEASDRHLITDLVLGTLRWRGRLQDTIARFSRRPTEQIDVRVQLILQLGIYQLFFTRIPQHAAVYETVNLCRRIKMTSAASFVNGLLRGVQGKLPDMEEPRDLARRWSHPGWLTFRWVERFGEEEAVLLMRVNNQAPAVVLRINDLKAHAVDVLEHLRQEQVQVEPIAAGVFRVTEGSPQLTRAFVDGEFYIQDAGVETLGAILRPQPGDRVLEIAAAPGGKTFQLALRMQDRGWIASVDSDGKRMKMWKRNIERLGIRCAAPVVADARALPFRAQEYDLVAVDAPCSSLGVIRRHPEIKWWRSEAELAGFGELQLQILDACAKYVRSRGALVYSVCSFEPEETSQVCERFLNAHRDFSDAEQRTLFPHRDGTDGFFVTRFEKRG